MGIHADVSVDLTELREWKDGLVSRMTGSVEKLCKANGVTLVEGQPHSPTTTRSPSGTATGR